MAFSPDSAMWHWWSCAFLLNSIARRIDDVERCANDSDWQPAKDAARQIAFAEDSAIFEGFGRLVRFLPRFLAFAREYSFYPKACNEAQAR
jgi:hypothetical protein